MRVCYSHALDRVRYGVCSIVLHSLPCTEGPLGSCTGVLQINQDLTWSGDMDAFFFATEGHLIFAGGSLSSLKLKIAQCRAAMRCFLSKMCTCADAARGCCCYAVLFLTEGSACFGACWIVRGDGSVWYPRIVGLCGFAFIKEGQLHSEPEGERNCGGVSACVS